MPISLHMKQTCMVGYCTQTCIAAVGKKRHVLCICGMCISPGKAVGIKNMQCPKNHNNLVAFYLPTLKYNILSTDWVQLIKKCFWQKLRIDKHETFWHFKGLMHQMAGCNCPSHHFRHFRKKAGVNVKIISDWKSQWLWFVIYQQDDFNKDEMGRFHLFCCLWLNCLDCVNKHTWFLCFSLLE